MDEVWKSLCSLMAALALLLNLLPWAVRERMEQLLRRLWDRLFSRADPFAYIRIPASSDSTLRRLHLCSSSGAAAADGLLDAGAYHRHLLHQQHADGNPLYDDVLLYISSLDVELRSKHVNVYGLHIPAAPPAMAGGGGGGGAPEKKTAAAATKQRSPFLFGLPWGHRLDDTFGGVQLWWTHMASDGGGEEAAMSTGYGRPPPPSSSDGSRQQQQQQPVFILTMLNSEKARLLQPYLRHISQVASSLRVQNKLLSYHTNHAHGSTWEPFLFKHPSTFDTIALPAELSERLRSDLLAFSCSEELYHRTGRAWKRGYLLYGPPGTGKSSLIAAIANFLRFDIYDLELTNVFSNTQLKNLLMQTKRRSIVVIEDIDSAAAEVAYSRARCDADFDDGGAGDADTDADADADDGKQISDRKEVKIEAADREEDKIKAADREEDKIKAANSRPTRSFHGLHAGTDDFNYFHDRELHDRGAARRLTLSGLLNFADGLMSSFGEERIFVFTTNHRERLDESLLRCGRMDMHILLPYCTFSAMKKLAFNYLEGMVEHPLFEELEKALRDDEGEVRLTPASVAEILIRNRGDPDEALSQVLIAAKRSRRKEGPRQRRCKLKEATKNVDPIRLP